MASESLLKAHAHVVQGVLEVLRDVGTAVKHAGESPGHDDSLGFKEM